MLCVALRYKNQGFVLALFREFDISVYFMRGYQRTFMVLIVIHLSSVALSWKKDQGIWIFFQMSLTASVDQ